MMKPTLFKISAGIFAFCILKTSAQVSDCGGNEKYGKDNPDSNKMLTNPDSYYLVCQSPYIFECCGVVDRWKYDADIDSQPLELQVWRKVVSTANTYRMISSYSHTAGSTGDQDFTPTASNYVTENDCIGWYSSGNDVIGYKTGGNDVSAMVLPASSVTNPENGIDWSGATSTSSFEWAIGVEVGAPSNPVFASASTVTVSDTLAADSLVLDLSFTDDDIGDTVALSMSSDVYFKFTDKGNNDGSISVKTSLLGQGGDVTVTVTGTDDCGHTTTQNVVITITNTLPTLTNLVSSITTSEDVPSERLITTFTCSDTSDSVTATISESPANTPPFFITKLTGSATDEYGIYVRSQYPTTNGAFNYSNQMSYTVTASCDDTIDTVTDNIIVYLSQNTPPVINNLPDTVNVSIITVDGTVIFDVNITDADGDTISASITTSPSPAPFSILDSGQVQVNGTLADFSHTGYDIYVNAMDAKNSAISKTLSVVINVDENDFTPVFSSTNYDFSVAADAAADTFIGIVTATDDDTGSYGTFSYALNQTSLPATYFKVDGSTGQISTLTTMSSCSCPGTTFSFPVLATDTGGLTATSTVQITVTTESTTDRFKTFWDDTRNIVWFSILMVVVAVTAIVTLYVCMKYVCMNLVNCKMSGTQGKGRFNRNRLQTRGYSPPKQEMNYKPKKSELVSVRQPPGVKHQWQYDMARF